MHIHHDVSELPDFKNAILTIGSFDGVHRGHQKIIQRLNHLATEVDGESVLITFDPHPRQVIYPKDTSLELLTVTVEKLKLFEKYGLDHVVIIPFSVEFSQQSPLEYLEKFILKNFNPHTIVIGYDHRFGLNRNGNINLLRDFAGNHNFNVIEIRKQEIEEITISSTKIRNALGDGDVGIANMLLGHPYSIYGKVVHGDRIGTQLGFPTANLSIDSRVKLIPADGVYAVRVVIEGKEYGGMLYIGNRPTINTKQKRSLEVNIFDFNSDIYDTFIEIQLIEFIRGDEKYENLAALRKQLAKDKVNVTEILEREEAFGASKNLSIAILNYNGVEYLEAYLPSVVEAAPDDSEIVVIDNASTDESVAFLEEWYPDIRIVNLYRNYGFAGGYNKGMIDVDSEFTLILNSDVQMTPGSIEPLLNAIKQDGVAAVQPCILSLEDKELYEYAGAAGGWMDFLGYPFCRGRIFTELEKRNEEYESEEIFWASGAAMLIKTKLFKDLGGFDAEYFAHQEEIDLCWRMDRAGYKIMYVNESTVYHLGGGTLSYENPRKTYLNFKNNLSTLIKNEHAGKLIWLLPLRWVLDLMAGVLFLSKGMPHNMWSVIKAHGAVLVSLRKLLSKRALYNKLIKKCSIGPPTQAGTLNKSIVLQYYMKGKKRFSDIEI